MDVCHIRLDKEHTVKTSTAKNQYTEKELVLCSQDTDKFRF